MKASLVRIATTGKTYKNKRRSMSADEHLAKVCSLWKQRGPFRKRIEKEAALKIEHVRLKDKLSHKGNREVRRDKKCLAIVEAKLRHLRGTAKYIGGKFRRPRFE